MTRTVVFIHGANVNSRCWDSFSSRFQAAGWTTHAPDWPGLGGEPASLREPMADIAALGIEEIVDSFARFIESLPEPPSLVGHSFGGLFTQLLLSRGLGRAAVALDSAPPSGIFPTPQALKAAWPIVGTFGHWKKAFVMSEEDFGSNFANGLPPGDVAAAWSRYIVPTPGRLWAQATWKPKLCKVDFGKEDRAPLLLCAGGQDRTVPASMNRANFEKYRTSAVTEFEEFADASHFLLAEPGWEAVADRAMRFLDEHHPD